MAYKLIERRYCMHTEECRSTYIVDTEDDIADLPVCNAGSVAIVLGENGGVYMTNTAGEWRKI